MNDLISRQSAIDAVCMEWCNVKHQDCKHQFDVEEDDYYWCDGCETVLRTLPDLPSAQPDGIPLEWIDKHLEWLDNCDNDFAQLAKVGIRAMVQLWKKDKT